MPSQVLSVAHATGFTAVSNAANAFTCISGGGTGLTLPEAQVQFECPQAGTIGNLYVRVDANTSAVDQTVTIRKNGASGGVAVTVTAGVGSTTYTNANTFTVVAGDLISLNITSGAGAGSVTYTVFSVIYTINAPNLSVQVAHNRPGGAAIVQPNSSAYTPVFTAPMNSGETAVTSVAFLLRTAADFTYLRTYLSSNGASSAGNTFALRVDGADSALSAALPATTTGEFLNTATTVTVNAGSSVSFRFANVNTNAGTSYFYTLTQVQRNSPWSNIGSNAGTAAFTSATRTMFWPLGGQGTTANTSELQTQMTARGRFRTQNMQVNIPVNAGGTTVCLRINSSNAISLALASGTVGIVLDSTQGPTITSTDLLNWSIQQTAGAGGGGFTLSGITMEMASIDTIPIRTLVGAGI